MSLLDRVQADFESLLLNTGDFGSAFVYTPAGSLTPAMIAALIIPEESRSEIRDGFRVRIDRIHVSAKVAEFNPTHGAKGVYDGRTWDFIAIEHDRGGGFVGAYFECFVLENAGPVSVSPI